MNFAIAHQKLLERYLKPAGIHEERVLRAFRDVPRHRFVDEAFALQAYADNSLPIGHNQTISKPTVVAKMIQSAAIQVSDRVLEVGTGSGYQTALLSRLARRVFSLDVEETFLTRVRPLLAELNCWNVSLRLADGHAGLAEEAPFDVIVVSAVLEKIPPALVAQLNPKGGRLVAPVKKQDGQRIVLLLKQGEGEMKVDLGPCVFVPVKKIS